MGIGAEESGGRFPPLRGYGAHAYNPAHSRNEDRKTTGSRSTWIMQRNPALKKNHLKFNFLFNKEMEFVMTYSYIYIMTFSYSFPFCSLIPPNFAAALPSNPPFCFHDTCIPLSSIVAPSSQETPHISLSAFILFICPCQFICACICLFIYLLVIWNRQFQS